MTVRIEHLNRSAICSLVNHMGRVGGELFVFIKSWSAEELFGSFIAMETSGR